MTWARPPGSVLPAGPWARGERSGLSSSPFLAPPPAWMLLSVSCDLVCAGSPGERVMLCCQRSRSQQRIPAVKRPALVLWAGLSFSLRPFPCVSWVIYLLAVLPSLPLSRMSLRGSQAVRPRYVQ